MSNSIEQLRRSFATMPHGGDLPQIANCLGCRPEEILDYSSNINSFGMAPSVRAAAVQGLATAEIYPSLHCDELRTALAEKEQLLPEQIHLGAGAAELIFRLAAALKLLYAGTGQRPSVLLLAPCFKEYDRAFKAHDFALAWYPLPAEQDYALDHNFIAFLEDNNYDVVVIVNPNNPTAQIMDNKVLIEVRRLCRERQNCLVIDECFLSFYPRSLQAELSLTAPAQREERLVCLHSFTKLFALPGLRAAWLSCASEQLSQQLRALCPAWPLSSPALAAALACLELEESLIDTWRSAIASERQMLSTDLRAVGAKQVVSAANFIFMRHNIPDLQIRLLTECKRPILIRSLANMRNLDATCYRLAVKDEASNAYFLSELSRLCRL